MELPALPHPATGTSAMAPTPAAPAVEREPVPAPVAAEPVIARTFDLTAEDDTLTLPRLDSLEQKLKDLERLYG